MLFNAHVSNATAPAQGEINSTRNYLDMDGSFTTLLSSNGQTMGSAFPSPKCIFIFGELYPEADNY